MSVQGGETMKYSILLILASLVSQAALAGWVVTYRDAEFGDQSQEFHDGRKFSTGDLIYTDKHFITIDRNSRSYWKGTPQQYCEAMDSLRKMMEAQIASMPAQYHPVPMDKRNVSYKKLGTKSIAGFNAKGYVFFADGGIQVGEVWVSSDPGLSGILNFEKSLAKDLKCFDDMAFDSLEGASLYKKMVKNKFILKEPGRQVISVEKKGISPTHFKVPAGYKFFSDYRKFMDHVGNASSSFSDDSFRQDETYYDEPENHSQATAPESKSEKHKDNVIVKDAKEISEGAVDEAHQGLKKGVQGEISKDIKKGVKGVLDSLF